MPYWEDELQNLLASLGVSLEPSVARLTAGVPSEDGAVLPDMDDEAGSDDEHHQLVHDEVAATIREVTRLAGEGALPPALHDDVLRVLRALTRPSPMVGLEGEEWDLASAVAVLHFCRIVQRMTNAISHLNHG